MNIFCLKWGNFELLDVFLVYFKVQNFMNKNRFEKKIRFSKVVHTRDDGP